MTCTARTAFAFWIVTMTLLAPSLWAHGVATYSLPQQLQMADVVCVGTVGPITVGEKAQFGTGVYGTPYGSPVGTEPHEVTVEARRATAQFTVERFLKGGAATAHIRVTFPTQFTPAPGLNTWFPLTQLVQGERVIVFLQNGMDAKTMEPGKEPEGTPFALFAPFSLPGTFADPSEPGPKIAIGSALLPDLSADRTPLRRTLRVLASALSQGSTADRATRLGCLFRIQSVGDLLALPADFHGEHYWMAGRQEDRAALGEPLSSDLDGFVAASVLPAVERLLTDNDAQVRDAAVVTCAALQDAAVVPRLAEIVRAVDPKTGIASSSIVGEARERLGGLRTPVSVRPLCLLLKDPSPRVREYAAGALREIGDRRSIPPLLDDLSDPDNDAAYEVAAALYTATQTPTGMPGPDPYKQNPSGYITHWREWATGHASEVQALRQQLAASPEPSLPPPPRQAAPPVPLPQGTGVITGRVIYEGGLPAAGVGVAAAIQSRSDPALSYMAANGTPFKDKRGKSVGFFFEGPIPKSIEDVEFVSAVTAADGTYRLSGVTSAGYNILVMSPHESRWTYTVNGPSDWVAAADEGVAAQEGQTVGAPDLVLTHGAVIMGRFLEAGTGRPLKGIVVEAHGPERPSSSAEALSAVTDSRGCFSLRVAPGVSTIGLNGVRLDGGDYHDQAMKIDNALWTVDNRFEASVDGGVTQQESSPVDTVVVETEAGQTHQLLFRLRRGKLQYRLNSRARRPT